MYDRVIVYDLVSRRHDKYLLLLVHSLTLSYQDLNVGQGLADRVISSLIAQTNTRVLIRKGRRTLEGDPLWRRLADEVDLVDRRTVLFTVADV
jgi:hypothetical protein